MKKNKIYQTSDQFRQSSYLSGENTYIESLYEDFLHDPNSVDPLWKNYFLGLNDSGASSDVSHAAIRETLIELAKTPSMSLSPEVSENGKQAQVDALIDSFRRFGHFQSSLDPIGLNNFYREDERLTLAHHGLADDDLSQSFQTRQVLPAPQGTLADIYKALQLIYCSTVGYEFMYIDSQEEQQWLLENIEQKIMPATLDDGVKKEILLRLTLAEKFEKFLDTKYPGQKRFSLEGLDTLIPMLHDLAKEANNTGLEEIKIAMAHRGRLNVLVNVLGQPTQELFDVFDGNVEHKNLSGDVKYHLGYSSDVVTDDGNIHFSMLFNPSHLEFVNPVAMGAARAKRDRFNSSENNHEYAMLVLLHGDASFCGQGIVTESLNMSKTIPYDIGGTLHIVTNNQVGYTNSNKDTLHSSYYCTGPAKSIDAPIFHVNADDPEAAVKVMRLAHQYRMRFNKDVVIDLVGFRRHGHQEVDEPRTTQPLMYQYIDQHPGVRAKYASQLVSQQVIDDASAQQFNSDILDRLDRGASLIETVANGLGNQYQINWSVYFDQEWTAFAETAFPLDDLKQLGSALSYVPDSFELQRNVKKIIESRAKMAAGEQVLDWGMAEVLAYASLMKDGFHVRLVGEDVRRGTFYHRHAVLMDQKTNDHYSALQTIADGTDVDLLISDSVLSETGALGFEYGYAMTCPTSLVVWEAQFGDFANVAQVIIDQFISSAWQKWQRLSGLVMLLPHGYEGMGPEHSSARLERYLQLAAQGNMQICVPTTPSQIFHLLRRQMLRPYRTPLIVMTPKSLLRHKLAVSSLEELSQGSFQLVVPEIDDIDVTSVTRVIVCSGKIYYELLEKRRSEKLDHVAILRIEQLYPFPYDAVQEALAPYVNVTELLWCQEEPKNQGAWFLIRSRLEKIISTQWQLLYSCRVPMAAPSAGHISMFKLHQLEVTLRALSLEGHEPYDAQSASDLSDSH